MRWNFVSYCQGILIWYFLFGPYIVHNRSIDRGILTRGFWIVRGFLSF